MSNLLCPLRALNFRQKLFRFHHAPDINTLNTSGSPGKNSSEHAKEQVEHFRGTYGCSIKNCFYKFFISDLLTNQMQEKALKAEMKLLWIQRFLGYEQRQKRKIYGARVRWIRELKKCLNKYNIIYWACEILSLCYWVNMRLSHSRNAKCMSMELRGRMISSLSSARVYQTVTRSCLFCVMR